MTLPWMAERIQLRAIASLRPHAGNARVHGRVMAATFALGRADYHQQFEAMLYGWKAGAQHYWCGARDQGNVWHFDKPARNDLHPTMKPVALVERAIRNSSKPRDTVLDWQRKAQVHSGILGLSVTLIGRCKAPYLTA